MKRYIALLAYIFMPASALAQTLDTSQMGANIDSQGVVNSVVSTLVNSIIPVAVAVFTIGAGLYVISGDKEDRKSKGKDLMVGALIGVAIVVGAKAILNLTIYFIYG